MPVILVGALLLDLLLGEPSNRWHPVAWLGRGLEWGRRQVRFRGRLPLLLAGGLLVLGSALLLAAATEALVAWVTPLGWPGLLLQAWLLKYTFSLRGFTRAAREVQAALMLEGLEEARRRVGWHLVSRPTGELSAEQVASAAVESVAENLTDSLIAPLLFFLVFGLPGAWAYRVVNTTDAMWGYRDGGFEYFGKPAARLDDLLNWIPARLAGFAIGLGAWVAGERAATAWRTMWREHGRTASPNAGWTMAAMAGALGVVLEKPGAYCVGAGGLPGVRTIDRAVRVMLSASGLMLALLLVVAALAR